MESLAEIATDTTTEHGPIGGVSGTYQSFATGMGMVVMESDIKTIITMYTQSISIC
jgi:hypothetical protein